MFPHKYGRLTVEGNALGTYYGSKPQLRHNWRCRCDCGTVRVLPSDSVRRGNTKSCGCFRKEWAKQHATTHGMIKSSEYQIWAAMKRRCYNKNTKNFATYGGKGITVCASWHEFANFIADMGLRPSAVHTLDRIDYLGNYEPSNCRWATQTTQQNNRCNNSRHPHKGALMTVAEIAADLGIHPQTVRNHLVIHGRTVAEMLLQNPPRKSTES